MAGYAAWALVPGAAESRSHPCGSGACPRRALAHDALGAEANACDALPEPPEHAELPVRSDRRHRPGRTRRLPGIPGRPAVRTRRRLAALSAGLATGLFLGGVAGCVAAPCVAALVDRQLARLPSSAERIRRQRIGADLPVAADLLSACLLAGAPPVAAVVTVSTAVGGPVGDELRAAAAAVQLGGDPARCWAALSARPELASLGRALSRSGEGGAPLAERIAHVADECRDRRRSELTTKARRTAVRATLPLGACFLPAFLLIGVVPVVIGLAAPLVSRT